MTRTRQSAPPQCWWCHSQVPMDCPYRTTDPAVCDLPGVGIVVCSPVCPQRPVGAAVFTRHRILT